MPYQVVKKMVYLYLCNYAQEHPDMALMCINTLHRDCNNEVTPLPAALPPSRPPSLPPSLPACL